LNQIAANVRRVFHYLDRYFVKHNLLPEVEELGTFAGRVDPMCKPLPSVF
jgi:hypothetical protein